MTDTADQRRQILIVDDAPENIQILGEVLKDYRKIVATNGKRALEIINGGKIPDLILLDIMMPEMDGYEVCRILKTQPHTKDIPVIFITAKTEVEDETHGLQLGAVDFISKPISPPVVLARIKNHLELLSAREILEEKNEELTARNQYITDSINYAQQIQKAILLDEKSLAKIFPESFVIFQPKDIVSGDFYWACSNDGVKVVASIDCTGHGVPGAFMSMLGNTILNKLIIANKITDPAQILTELNAGIIEELHKEDGKENFDGMDISLCTIDTSQKTITFAGAYRPLYCYIDGTFIEKKGIKKSIGEKKKTIEYINETLTWSSSTSIYLFSDGFIDQNNAEDKKYGSKKFREFLDGIHTMSMSEQKHALTAEFAKHKGTEVQRDDVTVIGIQVN